ncbi:F-box protein CPR1-like [Papaver somniferum]|uniref:F-box protein CPR1-like n=1 Tax=Papaver somniferum TaxID=3469 RepID=UPI000E6FAAA3|nr:F-box protein CPR1-like [Papaver somniferum]
MHLNHAVENNKYSVFFNTYYLYGPASCYHRVDFDSASASSLSDKAVKVQVLGEKIGKTPCVYHGTGADTYYSLKPLNEAMHWVARKIIVTDDQQEVTAVIVSFDIVEEKTKEMRTPIASCILNEEYELRSVGVGVLGKDLYLSVYVSDIFELWVMKDNGVVDSWTKLLSISNNCGSAMPLSFNGEIILFTCYCLQGNQVKNALVAYDLRNGRSTFLKIKDMPRRFTAETFMESLVSLNPAR